MRGVIRKKSSWITQEKSSFSLDKKKESGKNVINLIRREIPSAGVWKSNRWKANSPFFTKNIKERGFCIGRNEDHVSSNEPDKSDHGSKGVKGGGKTKSGISSQGIRASSQGKRVRVLGSYPGCEFTKLTSDLGCFDLGILFHLMEGIFGWFMSFVCWWICLSLVGFWKNSGLRRL